jgi:polar amino acid transport system substrate-binding protein
LEIYSTKAFKKKILSQDKGQREMVRAFIDTIKNGQILPISFEEIYTATFATIKIIESIRSKNSLSI